LIEAALQAKVGRVDTSSLGFDDSGFKFIFGDMVNTVLAVFVVMCNKLFGSAVIGKDVATFSIIKRCWKIVVAGHLENLGFG